MPAAVDDTVLPAITQPLQILTERAFVQLGTDVERCHQQQRLAVESEIALRAAIGFQQQQRLRVKDVNLLGGGIERASEPTGQVFAELPLGDIADDAHESRRLLELHGLDLDFPREHTPITPPST